MSEPILNVEHLTMRFGGLLAVDDLSFSAQRGDITAIIGPNGAGKTTVFNCITGFYKPTVGMIRLTHPDGRDYLLERLIDFRIAKHARVARTFQNIRLFPAMTGLENLLVAQHNSLMLASGYTVIGMLGLRAFSNAERAAIDKAKYWLDRIGLSQRGDCIRSSSGQGVQVAEVEPGTVVLVICGDHLFKQCFCVGVILFFDCSFSFSQRRDVSGIGGRREGHTMAAHRRLALLRRRLTLRHERHCIYKQYQFQRSDCAGPNYVH